jgi:hypothetical protein
MRNPDRKGGPFSGAIALGRDPAAVELHQATHDGKAETEAAVTARHRPLRLAEHFEHVRQEGPVDADA